jgi:hypothetical protein
VPDKQKDWKEVNVKGKKSSEPGKDREVLKVVVRKLYVDKAFVIPLTN